MEDIPNKIISNLGIIADVNLLNCDDKQYIEIVVEPSSMPISYHGCYHYRSGATKQELKGVALQQFILKKMGRSWDDIAHERAGIECIDRNAIDYFLKSSSNKNRLEALPKDADTLTVLRNLRLISDDGKLKYAALLLFAKDPQLYFPSVQFKIGRDRVVLWNPGVLPDGFTIENLFSEHHSHARNRNIAYAFHRAGFIEAWGRGIEKICKELSAASMQPPKFEQAEGGISVTIMRNTAVQTGHEPQRQKTSTAQVPHKYHISTT